MKAFVFCTVVSALISCLPASGETEGKTAPVGPTAVFTGGKSDDWFEPAN